MLRQVVAIAAIWVIATVAWLIWAPPSPFAPKLPKFGPRGCPVNLGRAAEPVGSACFTTITGVDPKTKQLIEAVYPLTLSKTRASADLRLEHRQKGLLWYSTYDVDFSGEYAFKNDTPGESIDFHFSFPAQQAVYDDFRMTVNGSPVGGTGSGSATANAVHLARGQTAIMKVAYKSHGLDGGPTLSVRASATSGTSN